MIASHVARRFHSGERYLTIHYRETICNCLIDSKSYRAGCNIFNANHRKDVSAEKVPLATFINDIIQEGLSLIRAKRDTAVQILEYHGFDGKTGLYKGNSLPEIYQNHKPTTTTVDPDGLLGTIVNNWDPSNPLLEEAPNDFFAQISSDEGDDTSEESSSNAPEYSEPDTDPVILKPRNRNRHRTVVPSEDIPSILENYLQWRNSQENMHHLCKILHSWELETNPSEVVYIMADAVYVKEQAKKHIKGGKILKEKPDRITHWNIKVEWDNKESYIVTDENIDQSFQQLIAFLLKNGLITRYMIFFTDGELQIFDIIDKYFSFWNYTIYLDYAHLEKKCYDLLSKGIKSERLNDPRKEPEYYKRGPNKGAPRKVKKTSLSVLYTRRLTSILWAGNVEEAKQYLRGLNPKLITDMNSIEQLLTYFENKGKYITSYALRKRVGLRNSSNGVEAVNNTIVANDQKISNKAYRTNGSHAAASIEAAKSNRELDAWFAKRMFSFEYVTSPA